MAYELLENESGPTGYDVLEPEKPTAGYEVLEPESSVASVPAVPVPLPKPQLNPAEDQRFQLDRPMLPGGMNDPGTGKEMLTAMVGDAKTPFEAVVNVEKGLGQMAMGAALIPGKLAYLGAADAMAALQNTTRNLPIGGPDAETDVPKAEYGGNLKALLKGEELPVDKFLATLSTTNPNLATVGKVSKSVAEMSPLAAVGMLPAWAARLVGLGFSAEMILSAPQQFRDYAEEINKPKEEQDPDKITTLQSDIIQTFAFAPVAGGHGAGLIPEGRFNPKVQPIKAAQNILQGMTPKVEPKPSPKYERPPPREPQEIKPISIVGEEPQAGEFRVTDEMTRPDIEAAQAKAREQIKQAWELMTAAEREAAERGKGLPKRFGGRAEDQTSTEPPPPAPDQPAPTPPPVPGPISLLPPPAQPSDQGKGYTVIEPEPPPPPAQALELPPTTTAFNPAKVATVEVPLENLKLSKDVPNFKADADETTGVVRGNELAGKYQRVGTAPIVAWERLNGDLEVITGRHRLDLARRSGEKTIPTQIVREADGFTRENALTFDAEANIRDGQGSVEDYAHYFRNSPQLTPQEAGARGLLARVKGQDGWSLGRLAADDLYALWADDKISTDRAVAIAKAAPSNADLQALGIKQALKGKSPADIANFIRVVEAETRAGSAEQFDMFGRDDSALKAAEEMAGRASKFQRDLQDQIRAVQSAAKRPEAAAKLGVNVSDPEGVLKRVAELKVQAERWQNWSLHPDLVDLVRGGGEMGSPMPGGNARSLDAQINKLREIQDAGGRLTLAQEAKLRALESQRGQIDLLGGESGLGEGVQERIDDLNARADDMARRATVEIERGNASTYRSGEYFENAKTYYKQAEALRQQAHELRRRFARGEPEEPQLELQPAEPAKPASPQMEMFSPPALGGGELGEGPKAPADNPQFSVIEQSPMEMPEAVQWVKLLTGVYPKIRERLRALGGQAAGVFSFSQGDKAKGSVSLRADIFDLLTPEEKAELRTQAEQYAQFEEPNNARERAKVAEEKYQDLLQKAYDEAKTRNPMQALKVMWHEIGHVVDWLPEHIIHGRGNILGRLASLKNFLKHVLPFDPTRPAGEKLTSKDRVRLEKEALDQLRAELGPIEEIVRTIIVEEPEFRITGITPEDVKNILRENAGRDTPELTRWFSEQSDKTKAEILRKAMRGILDERLEALGKKEQIGTRKTEKTVREKVGREPTSEEIKKRFAELLAEEMRKRNLADLQTVKAELEPLIAWWRGTEKMESYFKPSEEMYAEAFSAFANNPAAVAKRAPTYYRLVHNYMDRKPAVKEVYDQIQADLRAGLIMPKRVRNLYEMWAQDDARSLDTAQHGQKTSARDFFDNIAYHFDRTSGPLYRTARGYSREGQLKDARANYLYRATEHERFLAALNRDVGGRLTAANLDWSHDLGEYLFHKRVIEERFNIANPLGWTSKNSGERLAEMQRNLGPDRWAALEDAAKQWHRLYNEFVRDPVIESRMFSPELNQVLLDRAHYATFSAAKGVADTGIENIIKTQYGNQVTPHIYRQIGNLGEIKNPATATVLKGLSLISAVYRNEMKAETVRMMLKQEPENIAPAKMRFNGRTREPVIVDGPKIGTIVYLEDGKQQAYYTRKVIADAVNNDNPAYNQFARSAMAATGLLKGIFTQYNPGFWLFNFARDTMGFVHQMPGLMTPYHVLKNFPKALGAARASVRGKANPIAEEALRRKMLISRGDPRGTWASVNNEYEMKVASFGLDPAQWNKELSAVDRVVKVWNHYREIGQTIERVNKIGGMMYLDEKFPNMPEWKKREIVRERSGSPNFLERGASNPVIDLFALFYNPWKEGVRSVVKAAREDPVAFSTKAATLMLLPTVLQAAAYNGWLGDDLKKRMRAIPLYHLSNYLIPYAGWTDKAQGKVAAVRLPLFEPARIMHGIIFQALTGQSEGVMQHAGGQLPGLNPIWNVAQQWAAYLMGRNPMDIYRSVNVLSDQQQAARGGAFGRPGEVFNAEALGQMGKQTWNNLGGSMLYRFKNLNLDQPAETASEKWLSAPLVANMLGRWVLITSKGAEDQARLAAVPVAQREAETWQALNVMIEKRINGDELSAAEHAYLMDPFVQAFIATRQSDLNAKIAQILASRLNPQYRQLSVGRSALEKIAILQNIQGKTNTLERLFQKQ